MDGVGDTKPADGPGDTARPGPGDIPRTGPGDTARFGPGDGDLARPAVSWLSRSARPRPSDPLLARPLDGSGEVAGIEGVVLVPDDRLAPIDPDAGAWGETEDAGERLAARLSIAGEGGEKALSTPISTPSVAARVGCGILPIPCPLELDSSSDMSIVRLGTGGILPLALGPSTGLTRLVDEGGLSPPRSTRGLGGTGKRPDAAEPARERGGIINCASGASSSESEDEDEASVVRDREAGNELSLVTCMVETELYEPAMLIPSPPLGLRPPRAGEAETEPALALLPLFCSAGALGGCILTPSSPCPCLPVPRIVFRLVGLSVGSSSPLSSSSSSSLSLDVSFAWSNIDPRGGCGDFCCRAIFGEEPDAEPEAEYIDVVE